MNKPVIRTRRSSGVALFVASSGPRRGRADCEVAFRTRREALDFLTLQHGLTRDETSRLSKSGELALDRAWHGSERCRVAESPMSPAKAELALRGETA